MSSKAVSKGIISVGTWSATKLVVSGLLLPVYSRVLGIEGYGQYAYFMALLLLSSHPANFGMTRVFIKHIAERPDERAWHRALAGFAGSVNLGIGRCRRSGVGVPAFVFLADRHEGCLDDRCRDRCPVV